MFETKTAIIQFEVAPEPRMPIIIAYGGVADIIRREQGKIPSIKALRVMFDISLTDAKEIVEQTAEQMGWVFAAPKERHAREAQGRANSNGFPYDCPVCGSVMAMAQTGGFECRYFYCQGSQERYDAMAS